MIPKFLLNHSLLKLLNIKNKIVLVGESSIQPLRESNRKPSTVYAQRKYEVANK